MNDHFDRWMTAKQAGEYLGYSAWTIRDLCKRSLLKHAKAPGQSGGYRFRREWLDDFLHSRIVTPESQPTPRPGVKKPKPAELDPELHAAVLKARSKLAGAK